MPSWFKRPSLEIHIPISPTPVFLNMVHYLAHSLRRFGGRYRSAPIFLTIGNNRADHDLIDRHPWLRRQGVSIRWVSEELFAKESYYATALERFRYTYQSDVVLMLDADILIAGRLDDLIRQTHRRQSLGGLITHVPPVSRFEVWQKFYNACGLGTVEATCEHTGWGCMYNDAGLRFCPPYFNLGVICAPAAHIARIGQEIYALMHTLETVMEAPFVHFRCQLALSMAIVKLGIPHRCLPMRYNFANDPCLEARHQAELPYTRILHLLRDHQFYKTKVFRDVASVEAVLARRDLVGINALAQRILATVHPFVKQEQQEEAAA